MTQAGEQVDHPVVVAHLAATPLSPTTVRFVAQIARRQFMLLKSSRSPDERWLYRPVSISLSLANGGISRKARIALCTS
jgi:hypothetical protein